MFNLFFTIGELSTVEYITTKGGHHVPRSRMVNDVLPDGSTPLSLAIARGHVHIVRWLLAEGADIQALSSHDETGSMFELTSQGDNLVGKEKREQIQELLVQHALTAR